MAGTPSNAMNLNSTTSGLVNWDGVSVMSSTGLTQYDTLAAGSSNTIHNVAVGTAGQVLTSNGANMYPTYQTPQLMVIKSALVDTTSMTVQPLFTSPAGGSFVVSEIVNYSNSFVGFMGAGTYNIGWTAPDYFDLTLNFADNLVANNAFFNTISLNSGVVMNGGTPIPPSTPVFINVTTTATATTANETFYFIGFFL
jgi:hypothetical protein